MSLLQDLAAQAPKPARARRAHQEAPWQGGQLGAGAYATLDIVAMMQDLGLYGKPLGDGKHAVMCPNESAHSSPPCSDDSDCVVWEARGDGWPAICCQHAHCQHVNIGWLIERHLDAADRHCTERFTPTVHRQSPPLPEPSVAESASNAPALPHTAQQALLDPPATLCETGSSRLNLTDLGNAERLVRRHGRNLRYFTTKEVWLEWDGQRWREDETGGIYRCAKETVRSIYAEAARANGEEIRRESARWATRSEAGERITKMISLARYELGVPVSTQQLDTDPWLLNCTNGTLDLRSGNLRQHNRGDLITRVCPVKYDADAKCPMFQAFLRRSLGENQALIRYLRRVLGFALTGVPPDRTMWFFYGKGGNGKSTLLALFHHLLAGYAKKTPAETLLVKSRGNTASNDLAELHGARLVTCAELPQECRLNEARIKDLSGRERIKCRFLFHEFFEYLPCFKLFMYGNHRPVIRGTDDGIWDRLKLVPWTVQIPDAEKDSELPGKLLQELPGVLSWAVEGCLEWQKCGFQHPDDVRNATSAYRAEQDTLAEFISDCCITDEKLWVRNPELWKAYEDWCGITGEREPIGRRSFSSQLADLGFTPGSSTARGGRYWTGIGLRAAHHLDPDKPAVSPRSGSNAPTSAATAGGRNTSDLPFRACNGG